MHRKHKKGDLSLSVNAIVVFVLAFSMLGVGLFVVNLIRENVGAGIIKVVNLDDLKQPANSENPITIGDDVNLKKNKKLKLDIGFFNRETPTAQNAKIGLSECLDSNGDKLEPIETNIKLISPTATEVASSTGAGFKITMEVVNPGLPAGTYICTMVVYNSDVYTTIYEQQQFFLNVVA